MVITKGYKLTRKIYISITSADRLTILCLTFDCQTFFNRNHLGLDIASKQNGWYPIERSSTIFNKIYKSTSSCLCTNNLTQWMTLQYKHLYGMVNKHTQVNVVCLISIHVN